MYKPHQTQLNHQITTKKSESTQQNSKPYHVRSLNDHIENEKLERNLPSSHHDRPHIPQELHSHHKLQSREDTNEVVNHNSKEPVTPSMPEEYDYRNRKNFEEYCHEKRARPHCPFLRKGRCPSSRCLYFHPIITFHEDYCSAEKDHYPENSFIPTAPPLDNTKSPHNQPEVIPITRSYYPQPNYFSQAPPQTYRTEEENEDNQENSYLPTAPPSASTKSQHSQPDKIPMTKYYYQPNYLYQDPPQTYQPEEENLSRTNNPHQRTENRFKQRCPQMQQTHHFEIAQSSLDPNAYQFEAIDNQFYSQPHYHYSPISNLNQY